MTMTLDIGGEGRHVRAWNLNPSHLKTLGPWKGMPIPRHIPGRAEKIPLPDRSVDHVIVERTPLRRAALQEIARVIASPGSITLRHAAPPGIDAHALAKEILPGDVTERRIQMDGRTITETRFELGMTSHRSRNSCRLSRSEQGSQGT